MPSGPAHSPTPWKLVLSVTSSPWMVSQMDGAQSLTTSGQHLAGVFLPEHWFLGPPTMPSPRPSPPGSRASVTISAANPNISKAPSPDPISHRHSLGCSDDPGTQQGPASRLLSPDLTFAPPSEPLQELPPHLGAHPSSLTCWPANG